MYCSGYMIQAVFYLKQILKKYITQFLIKIIAGADVDQDSLPPALLF